MKKYLFVTFLVSVSTITNATVKDSTIIYDLPDSVKVVQFMAEINVASVAAKQFSVGVSSTAGVFRLLEHKGIRHISFFTYDSFSQIMAVGKGVSASRSLKGTYFNLNYNWELNKTYKLMIAIASDSAANFYLSSAYIFLPEENKWKFLGTYRSSWHTTLKNPQINFHKHKKGSAAFNTGEVWVQRSNGTWKNMKNEPLPNPTINWFGHIDSVQQRLIDIKTIEGAIVSGKTDVKNNEQGVYYTMMKEGTGRLVSVNDTVTAFYKGYLFVNDSVFDQTREKPATFPLKRLIKGWQIGVPLCRVGGKIKLVIPSDLAYSIRTRAAKIPPNSILVFEIEVLEAKNGN